MRGKRNINRSPIPALLLAAALVAVVALVAVLLLDPGIITGPTLPAEESVAPDVTESTGVETESQQRTEEFHPIELGEGLVVTTVAQYAGMYMEDGTNETVQDILMLILDNRSGQALQYATITFHYANGDAQFAVTNLPAGKQAVLLEQNRMPFTAEKPEHITLDNVVFLDSFPMYADIFQITGAEGCLNVRNISDQDIGGDIYVYYKNVGGGIYYGGITYRAKIEGGLAAGELRQVMTGHYDPDSSEILMVSYGA